MSTQVRHAADRSQPCSPAGALPGAGAADVPELPGSDHRRGLVAARCLLRVHQATRSEDASATTATFGLTPTPWDEVVAATAGAVPAIA